MGSWTIYRLRSENQNLPGFATIKPTLSHGGDKNWNSAFLLGTYQGTVVGHAGIEVDTLREEPIEYLFNKGLITEQQRYELDMLEIINRRHAAMR